MTPDPFYGKFGDSPPVYDNLDQIIKKGPPELRREDVECLRRWMNKQPHLPTIPDELIVTFLHASYYSIERTKTMIDKHFTIRTHAPDIFDNRDIMDPEMQKQLRQIELGIIKRNHGDGYFVSAARILPDVDPSEYIFDLGIKLCIMSVEVGLREEPTCPGHVLVLDAKGVTMAHVARAGIMTIRRLLTFANVLNLRLKAVHVLNVTPLIDYILALIKPFLSKELQEMIYFHSGAMEEFYKEFPKEIVPVELGGEKGSMKELHEIACWKLRHNRDYFLEMTKCKVDVSRRPGKVTNAETLFGLQGSFKRLEID